MEPIIAGASPLGPKLKEWLTRRSDRGAPSTLRARAALACAREDLITAEIALTLVDELPEVARPDAIAAYAIASDGGADAQKRLAGLPDGLLANWIFESKGRT